MYEPLHLSKMCISKMEAFLLSPRLIFKYFLLVLTALCSRDPFHVVEFIYNNSEPRGELRLHKDPINVNSEE